MEVDEKCYLQDDLSSSKNQKIERTFSTVLYFSQYEGSGSLADDARALFQTEYVSTDNSAFSNDEYKIESTGSNDEKGAEALFINQIQNQLVSLEHRNDYICCNARINRKTTREQATSSATAYSRISSLTDQAQKNSSSTQGHSNEMSNEMSNEQSKSIDEMTFNGKMNSKINDKSMLHNYDKSSSSHIQIRQKKAFNDHQRRMNISQSKKKLSKPPPAAIFVKKRSKLSISSCIYSKDKSGVNEEVFETYFQSFDSVESDLTAPTCRSSSSNQSSCNKTNRPCFERLYSYAAKSHVEGKIRRETIESEIEAKKSTRPKSFQQKISVKRAEKLYYRGVKKILDLDSRKNEQAKMANIDYQPCRFNHRLREKVLTGLNSMK